MKRGQRKQPGRRTRRVASVIREVVSGALVTELSDPRMAFVTVTGVDVSADMRVADVRISIMGNRNSRRRACGPSGMPTVTSRNAWRMPWR